MISSVAEIEDRITDSESPAFITLSEDFVRNVNALLIVNTTGPVFVSCNACDFKDKVLDIVTRGLRSREYIVRERRDIEGVWSCGFLPYLIC